MFVYAAVKDNDAAESKDVVVIVPVVAFVGTTVRITSPFPAPPEVKEVMVIPGRRTPAVSV